MVAVGFISLQLINSHFRCLEKLQPAYQVTFPGQEPIVKKGKICPIDITLAQRASNKKVCLSIFKFFLIFIFVLLVKAAPEACGRSQARGRIGAVAAGLPHSHSNAGSKPRLQPTPQLSAMPDP